MMLKLATLCLVLHLAQCQSEGDLPCSMQMEQEHKCIKSIYAHVPEDPIIEAQDPVFIKCLPGFDACIKERTAITDCRKAVDESVESDSTFQDVMSSMEEQIDLCFQRNTISAPQENYGGPNQQQQGFGPQQGDGNQFGGVGNRRVRRQARGRGGMQQLVQGQQGPPPPQMPEDSACAIKPNQQQDECLKTEMQSIQNNRTLHQLRNEFMQKRQDTDRQVMSCRNHVAPSCRPQRQDIGLQQCLCPATEIFLKEVYDRNEMCVNKIVPTYKIQQFNTRCGSSNGPLFPVNEQQ